MGGNVMNGSKLMYLERMTVEQADGLHRMYGVEFQMNDGRLVGITRIGTDYGEEGGDMTAIYSPTLGKAVVF